jgi:hypothetical protein
MPRTRTYGLDVDTIAYAARVKAGSGVTILPEPLKQLNKFIVGIKKLGLWSNTICWPMRSTHNAGKGSTVYSLGGKTYNGTLINNANWSYNGINMSAVTSDSIDVANFPIDDLDNGLNVISYFVPSGSSPATSTSSTYFAINYSGSSNQLYRFGHSGTGGTTSVMLNFYSNDDNRYFSGGLNWAAFIRNQPVCFAASTKKAFAISPTNSIVTTTNLPLVNNKTSPATMNFQPNFGDAACLLEFIIIIDNFNTIDNRLLIQNLYNKTLKTRQLYY